MFLWLTQSIEIKLSTAQEILRDFPPRKWEATLFY